MKHSVSLSVNVIVDVSVEADSLHEAINVASALKTVDVVRPVKGRYFVDFNAPEVVCVSSPNWLD